MGDDGPFAFLPLAAQGRQADGRQWVVGWACLWVGGGGGGLDSLGLDCPTTSMHCPYSPLLSSLHLSSISINDNSPFHAVPIFVVSEFLMK